MIDYGTLLNKIPRVREEDVSKIYEENYDMYGRYVELCRNGYITIYTKDINKVTIFPDNINPILNILRDTIELDFTQSMMINIVFMDGETVELSIMDYLINLFLWNSLTTLNIPITSRHLFFEENITKRSIKNYLDRNIVEDNFLTEPIVVNNAIDDSVYNFSYISDFSMYLANSINLEDTITLMKADKEIYEALHPDLVNVQLYDIKEIGDKYVAKMIERMKNSKDILGFDHCLADCWRAEEGVNKKQFREVANAIGTKPDGKGGIFPVSIKNSFLNGGIISAVDLLIESSIGRIAQIMTKMNVGKSGHFARILSLNNLDTILHKDPNYVCDSNNFEVITIKSEKMLKSYNNRYYRTNPNGIDLLLKSKDIHLIGTTIYIRGPMTCSSKSRGQGICYRCYGKLAYINRYINVGLIATDLLSEKLTQLLLSAKHILESYIRNMGWCDKFYDVFEIEDNVIKLIDDNNLKKFTLVISPDDISLESDEDFIGDINDDNDLLSSMYNEYITEFIIIDDKGVHHRIGTKENDNIYISTELNNLIRKSASKTVDEKISIKLGDLKGADLFYIMIQNNELTKSLNKINHIINNKAITKSYDRDGILQALLELMDEVNIHINAIHLEVILSNQVRSSSDILEYPEWNYKNEDYQILTLNEALRTNPSVTVSLLYQHIDRVLYNPLTFRKHKPSFMDLFFMENPQNYINPDYVTPKEEDKFIDKNGMINPITILDKKMYTTFNDYEEN